MEFLSPSTPCKAIHKKSGTPGLRVADSNCSSQFPKSPRATDSTIRTPSTPTNKSSLYSDRFIPDRNAIDFDYCYHSLCSSGDSFDQADDVRPEALHAGQIKLKCDVLQAASQTPGKRMISCFDHSSESKSPYSPTARKVPPTIRKHDSYNTKCKYAALF